MSCPHFGRRTLTSTPPIAPLDSHVCPRPRRRSCRPLCCRPRCPPPRAPLCAHHVRRWHSSCIESRSSPCSAACARAAAIAPHRRSHCPPCCPPHRRRTRRRGARRRRCLYSKRSSKSSSVGASSSSSACLLVLAEALLQLWQEGECLLDTELRTRADRWRDHRSGPHAGGPAGPPPAPGDRCATAGDRWGPLGTAGDRWGPLGTMGDHGGPGGPWGTGRDPV